MVLLPRLPTIPEQCVLVEDLVRTGGLGAGPSDNMATFSDAHSSNSELLIHLQAIYASTEVLEQLQQTLVPLMMRVFAATTNVSTRYRALLMVLKVLFFLDAGRLHKTLDGADLPQFVAGAVSQLEVPLLSAVLLLIMRVVLEKLPDYYTPHFIREGVFAGLGRLALAAEGVLDAPRSEDAVENVSSIKNIASGFKLIASHISALDYHEISGGSYHLLLSAESSSGAHARNADPLVCFVALQARALLPNFSLTSDTELPDGEYGAMRPLKLLAARLGASDCTDDSVRSCIEALAECLVSPESATSHELMQSGLVRVVTQALTRTRSSGQSLAIDVVQRLLRCNAPSQPNSLATSALGVLLNRLQDALGIVEQIRVQEAFQSATDASRSPARMLSHQLRFAVCPASADAAARITAASFGANFADAECLSNTMELLRRSFQPIRLGVHAVATFGVLETYLRPRIALLVRSARERRRRRNQVQSTAASSPTSASTPLIASPPRRAQLENVAIDPTSASCLDSPNRSISKRQRDHLRMLQAIARASGINLRTAGLLEGLETDNSTSNYDEDSVSEGSSAANLTANSNTQIAGASIVQASDTDDHVCLAAHDNVPEEQGDWHLTFLLCVGANEKAVTSSDNIFRAVYDLCQSDAELRSTNTWAQSFKLHFVVNSGPRPSSDCDVQSKDHLLGDTCSTDSCKDLYASIGEQAADIVRLLRLLYDLLPRAMSSAHAYSYYCLEDLSPLFVNRKIAAKTARQLDDPLMVVCSALPDWCRHIITAAPFLIPFELRVAFMQATCFGYSRNINRWQAIARRELHTTVHALPDLQIPLGHVQRQKVRISRRRMLESALKVIELYGSPKSILEVEYFDEVGSGIGPTLEFYATVSRCLQEKSIGLWRDERLPDLKADTYGHVTSPQFAKYVDVKHGLYPAYLDPERVSGRSASSIGNNTQSAKSLHTVTASLPTVDRATELFRFIGHFVAKGLIDGRILDIPFSTVFWAAVHRYLQISHGGGSEFTWTWFQLEALDAVLTNSLRYINQFVATTRDIYAREDLSPAQVQEAIDSIRHPNDQASVEDLALDFTLPGRPDIELRPGGAEIPVTIKNIHLYIDLVARWTLYTGVRVQVAAFCEGFDRVFSSKNLLMFTPAELCSLVGQDLDSNVHWSMDELVDAIKTDHGFSLSSSEVQMFLEFLTSLENPDRRMLLQFVTGSPRLPLGGFRSLQPPLTLVPRTTSPPLKPDDYLPSVMTCANFIKLPRYSSFDVLAQRWRQAISEGQQSFHLS
ncbi:hypothetical protein COEREDRAFT_80691 [Coemansia reversa NRRL 1564]|uniref:HECT domain-containing protein n=1 Tax=Coemansia reversa (strain ATCC 12441 / NRRL 1564) TaxID=763665 RepID=A0A2G5BEE4_COERN|nr:hypothetical protein COEREDRAFT_80691 [Coemansia reversa NRRL 1564]|eukprot:PIA17373.1 hypothetical protein COEREDRAFT_80691 [Coemansia reversa NRRL 1564]